MLSVSSIYSVGAEQLYPGSNSSHCDYLDEFDDLKYPSVGNESFYQSRATYEISGFYSDEDEDDANPPNPQPYLSPVSLGENKCYSEHARLSMNDDVATKTKIGCRTTRKRSFTNFFKARPESAINNSSSGSLRTCHDSLSIRQAARSDTSWNKSNLDTCPSLLRNEASQIFLARPSHLSQARRNLLKKSIDRHITVGFQPHEIGLSAKEQNECFQKIWIHQQNRIEAHHKMICAFELIPEEEESSSS